MTRNLVNRRLAAAFVCLAVAWCGEPCRGEEPKAAEATGLDAAHVKTEAPATLVANQVFEAKITVKNTGARAWNDQVKLRAQGPLDNVRWGTSLIYLGQGRSCKPGEEITLASFLKAPAAPGEHVFQWRMARMEDGAMFGPSTPPVTIVVKPRSAGPPPKAPAQPATGKRVLSAADFEYVGSFKLPEAVEGCGAAFTESGLALRKRADGAKTLFLRTGLEKCVLYEAAIPRLARLEGGDHSTLTVARVERVWGEIKLPGGGDEPISADAGFWWDEDRRLLYWSYYHGYMTGRVPVLAASRLEEGKPVQHFGPWHVPESVPWFKSYWGGVTRLSKEFARQHTGGRTLALGFGGYYSICAAASRGPALAAVAEPDPAKKTLDVVELLTYPWEKDSSAPRDGNYFVANCGWGGRPPDGPQSGYWTMDDWSRAGVFIDLPDVHGYMALAFLGTGRIGYDYGTITSAGRVSAWYFYDPKDLGEAAQGARKPWEVAPHSRANVAYPRGVKEGTEWGSTPGDATGCCFDPETRLLYVYQRFTIDNGSRELFPCVHAYRVK